MRILGLEWCMWRNMSTPLGIGYWLSQGKGRLNLCEAFKGSLLILLWFEVAFAKTIMCSISHLFCNYFWLQVLLDDGKTERIILAQQSSFEASQEAVTEYRVLGPTINGCSWIELRPHTMRKHQVLWEYSYLMMAVLPNSMERFLPCHAKPC